MRDEKQYNHMLKSFVKLFLITLFCFVFRPSNIYSQQYEPKWVGAVNILSIEGDTISVPAEKANVQIKTTQSAGKIIFDIGNIRQKGIIKGSKSPIQCDVNKPIYIVVKCKENEVDPTNFIQIIKFEETRKERRTELAMENWLGNTSELNSIIVPYEADTYGKSSYILRMEPQEGEFGVRILNPDALDSRAPIFYCFGSHVKDAPKQESFLYNGIYYPLQQDSKGRYYIMISKDEKMYIKETEN